MHSHPSEIRQNVSETTPCNTFVPKLKFGALPVVSETLFSHSDDTQAHDKSFTSTPIGHPSHHDSLGSNNREPTWSSPPLFQSPPVSSSLLKSSRLMSSPDTIDSPRISCASSPESSHSLLESVALPSRTLGNTSKITNPIPSMSSESGIKQTSYFTNSIKSYNVRDRLKSNRRKVPNTNKLSPLIGSSVKLKSQPRTEAKTSLIGDSMNSERFQSEVNSKPGESINFIITLILTLFLFLAIYLVCSVIFLNAA